MKRIGVIGMVLLLAASTLAAQAPKAIGELRPFVGVSVPTGAQRDFFKEGPMAGVQGAVEIRPFLHAVGTVGWVLASDKYLINSNANILSYNAGIELGPVAALPADWQFMPFIGVGGGARTYLYSGTGLSDRTCTAGYGAVGGEFKVGLTAFRLEARDNLFCYKSPYAGAASQTRNDLGFAIGIAYHLR